MHLYLYLILSKAMALGRQGALGEKMFESEGAMTLYHGAGVRSLLVTRMRRAYVIHDVEHVLVVLRHPLLLSVLASLRPELR